MTGDQLGYCAGVARAQQQCLESLSSPLVDPPVRLRFGFRSSLRPLMRATQVAEGVSYSDGLADGYSSVLQQLRAYPPEALAVDQHDRAPLVAALHRLVSDIERRQRDDGELLTVLPAAAEVWHGQVSVCPRCGEQVQLQARLPVRVLIDDTSQPVELDLAALDSHGAEVGCRSCEWVETDQTRIDATVAYAAEHASGSTWQFTCPEVT